MMKAALAQNSFSTKDTDSATRQMESMKLSNSPGAKAEKDSMFFDDIHCMGKHII